jgi:hypothetical protein
MPTIPGGLLNWVELRFFDDEGAPLSLGSLEFYIAGTSTPKAVYSDADLTSTLGAVVTLTASGRPATPIFLQKGGYKIIVKDLNDVEQYSLDGFMDIGQTFFENLAVELVTGSTGVTSGYTVTDSDAIVVVTNAGGDNPATVTLQAASDRTFPLIIKNKTAVSVQINPDGSDTIEDVLTSYTIGAAASPVFPSVRLLSDGVSTYWIEAVVS